MRTTHTLLAYRNECRAVRGLQKGSKLTKRRRIAEAEEAVLARGRELFYRSSTRDEKELLQDALYALRAFRTAWEHTEAAEAV